MCGKKVIVIMSVGTACAVLSFLSDTPCEYELYNSICFFFKLFKATTKGLQCNHSPCYVDFVLMPFMDFLFGHALCFRIAEFTFLRSTINNCFDDLYNSVLSWSRSRNFLCSCTRTEGIHQLFIKKQKLSHKHAILLWLLNDYFARHKFRLFIHDSRIYQMVYML